MNKLNKKGFTLIELMAVVIVLLIVIFIAITKVNDSTRRARDEAVKANAATYIKGVNSYVAVESVENEGLENTILSYSSIVDKVKISGTKPDDGTFTVTDSEVSSACLIYDGYKITYKNGKFSSLSRGECGDVYFSFSYTGSEQVFIAPIDGIYKIELWGAGGGKANATFSGANLDHAGYGGYTSGNIYLNSGDTLYVYVGKKGDQAITGSSSRSAASFNGGGAGAGSSDNDDAGGSGGGATDIRLVDGNWNNSTSLASRIMVAAGGAGSPVIGKAASYHGGYAGGLTGVGNIYRWENSLVSNPTVHATQTSGYLFGIGQDATLGIGCAGSGGGGGYWGGKAQTETGSCGSHGGGGSSYISGYTGCVAITSSNDFNPRSGCTDGTTNNACSIHYSGKKFANGKMIAGNESMPTFDGKKTMVGNKDNGYAKISMIDTNEAKNSSYSYTGNEQLFIVPVSGKYKLEVWGAQGANSSMGGYGGYSVGEVQLQAGNVLYINVGGSGEASVGGYNGGASCGSSSGGKGGGATSITTTPGLLSTHSSNISSILIVAGGGGGYDSWDSGAWGGSGGGFKGVPGTITGSSSYEYAKGGSQTNGGDAYCGNYGSSPGSFGNGGAGNSSWGGGGGGGFYGGGGGGASSAYAAAGGGGSGYIGSSLLSNKSMYCYHCTESDEPSTKTDSVDCNDADPKPNCAKKGNGYAKISFIE